MGKGGGPLSRLNVSGYMAVNDSYAFRQSMKEYTYIFIVIAIVGVAVWQITKAVSTEPFTQNYEKGKPEKVNP